MYSIPRTLTLIWVTSMLAACGGSQPEAKEPPNEEAKASSEEKAPPSDDKAEAPSPTKSDKKPEAASASESSTSSADSKPKRSLKDMLTAQRALFVFSFTSSDMHQAAEEKCGKKAGDDPKKKADCMTKASAQFDADALQFTEQGETKGEWLTLRRKGNTLKTLHKVDVEFGKETDKSITLVLKGGKEVVIEVPNESEIVLNDPKNGKMVYELKLGLIGESER